MPKTEPTYALSMGLIEMIAQGVYTPRPEEVRELAERYLSVRDYARNLTPARKE